MAAGTRTGRIGSYPESPGVALIINLRTFRDKPDKTRHGAEHDENYFSQLFGLMGFKVIRERDSTKEEFVNSLHAAMGHFVESKYCAGPFFLCIMSHGNQDGVLFHDGETLLMERIVLLFNEDHCKNLEGRAKVILIQACRGHQYLAAQPDGSIKECRYEPKPSYTPDYASAKDRQADILVFQSCIDSRLSFRSPKLGSHFVRAFCQVVLSQLKDNQRCEILDVTKEVTTRMERMINFEDKKVFGTCVVTMSTIGKNLYLSIPEKNRILMKGVADNVHRVPLIQHQDLADDGTSRWCTCKTGCRPSSQCKCQRDGVPCGPGCHQAEDAKCVNKSRRCGCASTCQTGTCGCYKADASCGPDCHPRSSMCRNGEASPSASPAGRAAPPHGSKSSQDEGWRRQEAATQHESRDGEATASCGCKAGCGTRRCGCLKAGKGCNAKCHPTADNCENKQERPRDSNASQGSAKMKAVHGSSECTDSRATDDSTASEDSEATTSCGCKTGCGTRRCGCMKDGRGCNAMCHPNANNCENKRGRGTAPPVSSAGRSKSKSVSQSSERLSSRYSRTTEDRTASEYSESEESESEDSESEFSKSEDKEETISCGCKTGCGTRRCGCMKAGKGCDAKCHPNANNCENKRERGSMGPEKNSTGRYQSKLVPQSSGRLTSRATGDRTASEDREETISCGCKTGCGTRRCGCMKAGKGCDAKCHPNANNCENKRR